MNDNITTHIAALFATIDFIGEKGCAAEIAAIDSIIHLTNSLNRKKVSA